MIRLLLIPILCQQESQGPGLRAQGPAKSARDRAQVPRVQGFFVETAAVYLPYVLPQWRSCLTATQILSCHLTHLVLPQERSFLVTLKQYVFAEQHSCFAKPFRFRQNSPQSLKCTKRFQNRPNNFFITSFLTQRFRKARLK